MFKVGDRVKVLGDDELTGKLGTVVLVDDVGYLDYIVSLDGYRVSDPFSLACCEKYGVPDSSIPFDPEELELVNV
jgi:hypothetical protein